MTLTGFSFQTILRNILHCLMYNDEYSTVDENMTDCNVGLRKERNIRDNLFVKNAIIKSSKKGLTAHVTYVFTTYVRKCVDIMWLSECINDRVEG